MVATQGRRVVVKFELVHIVSPVSLFGMVSCKVFGAAVGGHEYESKSIPQFYIGLLYLRECCDS